MTEKNYAFKKLFMKNGNYKLWRKPGKTPFSKMKCL